MALLITAYVAVADRVARLNRPENRDRGEGPVSTVIIVAGLALLAIAIMTWAYNLVQEYMVDPGTSPQFPAGG